MISQQVREVVKGALYDQFFISRVYRVFVSLVLVFS